MRSAKSRKPFTRHIGVVLDREVFERELAARGLEAKDLAKLSGLDVKTLSRARQGARVNRDTLMRIATALEKVPVRPIAAALAGVAEKTSAAGGSNHQRREEVRAVAAARSVR